MVVQFYHYSKGMAGLKKTFGFVEKGYVYM